MVSYLYSISMHYNVHVVSNYDNNYSDKFFLIILMYFNILMHVIF